MKPLSTRLGSPSQKGAFTLVEILIVIAIAGIMMTLGIPAVLNMMNQDSFRKNMADLMEGCRKARAEAIISGKPAQLRFNFESRTLSVSGSEHFQAKLSDRISIETWGVNFVEMKDADEAVINFYPNGTCDEFATVIRSEDNHARKISLEVITGLPDMEVLK